MLPEKTCYKPFVKLSGMLLFMATLLFFYVQATAIAEESPATAANLQTAAHKDLKPFNNLDELLYLSVLHQYWKATAFLLCRRPSWKKYGV